MSLLLLPISFVSILCIILGFFRIRGYGRQGLIVLFGLPILTVSFSLAVHVIDGFVGGFIESRMGALWTAAKLMTISDGDIYLGGVGVILVLGSAALLATQLMLLFGPRKHEEV